MPASASIVVGCPNASFLEVWSACACYRRDEHDLSLRHRTSSPGPHASVASTVHGTVIEFVHPSVCAKNVRMSPT